LGPLRGRGGPSVSDAHNLEPESSGILGEYKENIIQVPDMCGCNWYMSREMPVAIEFGPKEDSISITWRLEIGVKSGTSLDGQTLASCMILSSRWG